MPGYPCCCAPQPNIECCDPAKQPPAEIAVDLGIGGWIDEACGYCDQVLGTFIVARVADRTSIANPLLGPIPTWEFKIADVCAQDGHDLTLVVMFQLNCSDETVVDPPPDCMVGVYLTEGTDERDFGTTPNVGYFAQFAGELGTSPNWDCRLASPVTCTKTTESPAPFVGCCDGSLPGTIDVEAA